MVYSLDMERNETTERNTMTAAQTTYEPWRKRVEDEIANHIAHGKTPKNEPKSEAEWRALYTEIPRALYASWFVLTGKRVG